MFKTKSTQKSFTLLELTLELLIVIAVIAILVGIILLVSLPGARQNAMEARGLQFSQNIHTTLSDSLVAEWSFDDSTNPGRDDSGNGNNGTVYSGTTVCNYNPGPPASGCPVWTQGKVRGALSFDGMDDYVDCGNHSSLMPSSITIEGWIMFNATENGRWTMINKALAGTSGSYYIYGDDLSSGIWSIWGPTGTRYDASFLTTFKKNKWYHLVGSFDASTGFLKAYVNGQLKSTTSGASLGSNPQKVFLGRYVSAGYYLDGLIDEVRIYNRALTAYEIKALYVQGKMRHLAEK